MGSGEKVRERRELVLLGQTRGESEEIEENSEQKENNRNVTWGVRANDELEQAKLNTGTRAHQLHVMVMSLFSVPSSCGLPKRTSASTLALALERACYTY